LPNYWLLKTEPSTYSFAQLERDSTTTWNGIRNAAALAHIRAMTKGDLVLIYHSGKEKQIVGVARVAARPYPDPNEKDAKFSVVDLRFERWLKIPVTLATIRGDRRFKDFPLVSISRLSALPVRQELWRAILELSESS
jgi:predicted RNA-binding protein with PUA-like domain